MFFRLLSAFAYLACLLLTGCGPAAKPENQNAALTFEADSAQSLLSWSPEDEMLGLGQVHLGDLDSIIKRRVIRALVPYTPTYYFIDGNNRKGLAFEALNRFETYVNKQLKFSPPQVRVIFIPVSHDQLLPLLEQGYGDIAMGGVTILEERKSMVDFSTPTMTGLNQIVVAGPNAPMLTSLNHLAGQRVAVYKVGSYRSALQSLSDSLRTLGLEGIHIDAVDQYLAPEDILEMVNAGIIPFTVVEDDMARLWAPVYDSLKFYPALTIRKNSSYGVAFRKGMPKFKAMTNRFVEMSNKGTLTGNLLYHKYYQRSERSLTNAHSEASMKRIQAVQSVFRKYADQYQLDWLLLISQAFQESRLDNSQVSRAGAVGIMQVKPSTAAGKPISIKNVHLLENNVHAGAKYVRHIMDYYYAKEDMDELNKHLFALAAYNAGPSRIANLRKLAQSKKLNPNVWFNQVEMVVAHEVGRETVQYVSNIYKYYISMSALRAYERSAGKDLWPARSNP